MVEVAQQVQMLLKARVGGRGRSTSPNVTQELGLVVKVAQQVQMLLGPRVGGRGRSTSPNVTQN